MQETTTKKAIVHVLENEYNKDYLTLKNKEAQALFNLIKSNINNSSIRLFYRLNEKVPQYRCMVEDKNNSKISYIIFFDGEFEKE